ncbi:MAG: cytochrome d ubiquinol oxidase subunit II [Burkholderiaceae bacterium]
MGIDLPLVWAIIILFGVMMYVVMDGFDLGIGLLFLAVTAKGDRDVMMNTVAPVWDGNETWLVLAVTWWLLQALRRDASHAAPFVLTLALVFLGYSGLGISLWPYVIPPATSIWDAAGPPQSLGFALVGALLIIPLILMYTAWGYWVFRGKVRHGESYH